MRKSCHAQATLPPSTLEGGKKPKANQSNGYSTVQGTHSIHFFYFVLDYLSFMINVNNIIENLERDHSSNRENI